MRRSAGCGSVLGAGWRGTTWTAARLGPGGGRGVPLHDKAGAARSLSETEHIMAATPITIAVTYARVLEETDEVGSDEPYVMSSQRT
jgi:hypothetical protein